MKLILENKTLQIVEMNSFWQRLKGLMFKKEIITKAYCFKKCNSIHTFFMRQAIDVIMTDKNNKIIYTKENMKPNRIILPKKRVCFTYELPTFSIKNLTRTDLLNIE